MIRAVRRNRLLFELFPDAEIPVEFIEAWRLWSADHPAVPPPPLHCASADNGEGSSRQPLASQNTKEHGKKGKKRVTLMTTLLKKLGKTKRKVTKKKKKEKCLYRE
jgi:hypothetical protein